MINEFKPMKLEKQEIIYGGWAWLATAIPLLMQISMNLISSYKMFSSSDGYTKFNGMEAHWTNDKNTSKTKNIKPIFYAF